MELDSGSMVPSLSDFPDTPFTANATLAPTPAQQLLYEVSAADYLFMVAELCVGVFILLGNGLTIAAVVTTPSLQSVTYR